MKQQPLVSVIIPVYNAAKYLSQCLVAIKRSSYPFYEIIVVDDGSTDGSAEVGCKNGAFVLQLQSQSGPAAARNYGAEKAKGDVLLFVDSDVLVQQETIARVARDFSECPDIGALFGSYDDDPLENNFISQYKNLLHHFVHQISDTEAVTFWAGCGAVRKEAFNSVGGFDEYKYSRPCIEDIELGYRLRKMGYRILLDKDLQVKHLKKWTFKSLLRADILHRAIPWTKLILESQEMVSDLNLQVSQKISTGLLGLIIAILPLSFFIPELIYLILCLLASILTINHKLFNFFLKRKGLQFTFLAFAMYLLYYFYSGASYASCWLLYKARN
ncbi:MAG: glycosyltransferase family 2 protein [Candidatus Hodarchaeales archaeon]|jgi:glycosyltransferase involved in cell wall biosynthesis